MRHLKTWTSQTVSGTERRSVAGKDGHIPTDGRGFALDRDFLASFRFGDAATESEEDWRVAHVNGGSVQLTPAAVFAWARFTSC